MSTASTVSPVQQASESMLSLDVGSSLLPRYEDALVLLLTEVLNRIQFRYNQAQLEELDDETLDDDVRGTSLLLVYLISLLLKMFYRHFTSTD